MRYRSAAYKIARCAVMTALLIAVQYALGFVPGVELVTVFLLTFSYTAGAGCGMATATSFSLLRCFLWGFYPNVVVLYLLYFNAFALLFGALGRRQKPVAVWVCPALLLLLALLAAVCAGVGLPVGKLMWGRLSAMLWALFGVLLGVLALYLVLLFLDGAFVRAGREVASLAALAALCTLFFTLLDDVLTPLFYGYAWDAAVAYFYAGFFAMIPQIICASVSVLLLLPPLLRVMRPAWGRGGAPVRRGARKSPPKGENAASNDGRTQKDVV